MQRLYDLGGRKFTIAGLPPLGCLPFQITTDEISRGVLPPYLNDNRTCVEDQNQVAVDYNSKLRLLITKMQSQLPRAKFAYVDVYIPLLVLTQSPEKFGELIN